MASTPQVLTFAEFEQLPWPEFGKLQLRNGELFQVAPAKDPRYAVARKLRRLLDAAAVARSDGYFHTYKPGDQIPLHFGGSIAVNDIFSCDSRT